MASTATASRNINVAPGTVWQLWRDLPAWKRWQPDTFASDWLGGAPWEPGATFAVRRRGVLGREARYTGRVLSTAHEQLLVWELQPERAGVLTFTIVESVRLEPTPAGTRVTFTRTAHGPLAGLLSPLNGFQGQTIAVLEGLHHTLASAARRL